MTADARGHVRVPDERQEALRDECERSALSGVTFALLAGVKYPTFALWVQKRRKARNARGMDDEQSVSFAEALVDRSTGVMIGAAGLAIGLLAGARLIVQSPAQRKWLHGYCT